MRARAAKGRSEGQAASGSKSRAKSAKAPAPLPIAQRAPGCACGGGCPRCQEEGPALQAKLKVNQPGDRYEREAERVAERVMRMALPGGSALAQGVSRMDQSGGAVTQRQEEEGEEEEEEQEALLQAKLLAGAQAQEIEEEEEEEGQAQSQAPGTGRTRSIAASIPKGSGQPLSPALRAFFEPRFGTSFSRVRLHTDGPANEAAGALHARAFTVGRDIYFNRGQFQPESEQGRRLLAHELTHTLQQRGVEAADAAMAADSEAESQKLSSVFPMIQRQEAEGVSEASPAAGTPGSAPGTISPDEVLEPVNFDLEGLTHVDEANLTGGSGANGGAPGGEAGEAQGGFKCPNILEPITEFAGQESSPAGESDSFTSIITPYLPPPFNVIAGGAGAIARSFWDGLPFKIQVAAIDSLIDAAVRLVREAPAIAPGDKYVKIALIAFLGRLRRVPDNDKVRIAEKMGSILLGTNVNFTWGLLKGLVIGFFVDGMLGIYQMIIDLVCMIPMFFQFIDRILRFIEMFPEAVRETVRQLLELKERVQEAMEEAVEDLLEIYNNPERIVEFLSRIEERAAKMAGEIGERAATRMLAAFEAPAERLGYVVGRVIGVILFELVLAIVSGILTFYIGGAGAAGSAAVSAGKTALRAFMSALRRAMRFIMKMIRPIVRLVSGWIDKVKDFVIGLGRVLTQAWRRVATSLSRLLDRVKDLFRRFLTLIGANRFFLEYIARVRLMAASYRFTGVRRSRLLIRANTLRRRPRFLRVVSLATAKPADNRGFWIVKAGRRGIPIKIAIAEALMHPDPRMKRAKKFIQAEIDDIPDRSLSTEEIADDIRDYREAFAFSTLEVRYDSDEDAFDVTGAMSPGALVATRDSPWPTGEREDPIPIRWFRRPEVFPVIKIYREDENGNRILDRSSGISGSISLPPSARLPSLLLMPSFGNLRPRVPMKKIRQRGSETKQRRVRDRLKGSDNIEVVEHDGTVLSGSRFSPPYYAIDHLRELKFSGEDELDNLWPVRSTINDAFNANFYQVVRIQDSGEEPEEKRVSKLHFKWFKVADVADSVPSSKGDHGTSRIWPINRGRGLGGVTKKFQRRDR